MGRATVRGWLLAAVSVAACVGAWSALFNAEIDAWSRYHVPWRCTETAVSSSYARYALNWCE